MLEPREARGTTAVFRITFLPDQRSVDLDEPLELSLAASRADIWQEHPCGGKALCGRCRVRVVEGDAIVTESDRRLLEAGELAAGWRLGCRLTIDNSCTVEVPAPERAAAIKSFGPHGPLPADIDRALPAGFAKGDVGAFGVAVDLGSTTLAAALVDMRDGRVVATASALNPQARVGADIMSRIHFAQQRSDGNARLHDLLADAVRELIAGVTRQAGLDSGQVAAITCVGNATMTHAAVGADVRPLGEAPYRGSFVEEREFPAAMFGWPAHRSARVRFAPMIGSHVGGDTVAGILACDIDRLSGWRLLVDLGTNAEVVLGCRDRLLATSTAAGPAFDGANIAFGMRAMPGAIDAVHVRADGHLVTSTVGGQPPVGLCGSGLVDAVAELRKAGVIAASGYMRSASECETLGVPPSLVGRVGALAPGERAVRLAGDVMVTASDVRQLQLAKGSIAAGIALLIRRLGLRQDDLEEILVAGTFGTFLRKESLLEIGLVPAIDPLRVRFVGNAAGAGARLMLVDARSRRRALEIARRAEYVDLAGDPDYQEAFCDGVPFPETT